MERESNAMGTVTLQSNCGNLNVQIKIISDSIPSCLIKRDF